MMLVLFLFTVSIPAATSHLGLVRCTRLTSRGFLSFIPISPVIAVRFPFACPHCSAMRHWNLPIPSRLLLRPISPDRASLSFPILANAEHLLL
jgi:hypothetical protein